MLKTVKSIYELTLIIILFVFGINKSYSQVTDYDGYTYKTVKICTQEWMAENLIVSHYRNGDSIPHVKDSAEWSTLKTGAWCYYENNSENGKTYGILYNWYAVMDPRGLAPEGWHIPSEEEWKLLEDALGGYLIAGGKLKATTLWLSPNTGATNESGFSGFPGGLRDHEQGFKYINKYGCFWSSSEEDSTSTFDRNLKYDNSDVFRYSSFKSFGLSVRCVRD